MECSAIAERWRSESAAVWDSILGRAPGPHDGADVFLISGHDRDIGFAADLVGDRIKVIADDDLLGIEDDVRTLCRLLLARSTQPPLAVGVFGDWGAGKSFFLQRIRGYSKLTGVA